MIDPQVNKKTPTESLISNLSDAPLITPQHRKKLLLLISVIFMTLLIAGAGGYFMWSKSKTGQKTETADKTEQKAFKPEAVQAASFGSYKEISVNADPKVPSYAVQNNLANITNKDDFTFSDSARNLLVKNAFVVIPAKNS